MECLGVDEGVWKDALFLSKIGTIIGKKERPL